MRAVHAVFSRVLDFCLIRLRFWIERVTAIYPRACLAWLQNEDATSGRGLLVDVTRVWRMCSSFVTDVLAR
jgi:hypothetical protein